MFSVAFSEEDLSPGEKIILQMRPHWWYFASQVGALLLAIVLGVMALSFGDSTAVGSLTVLLLVLVLIWFLIRYISWSTTELVLTSDRLVSRGGVLVRHSIEIPLDRINTVFQQQSLIERMIGSGDLEVESAGERGTQEFHDIRDPQRVQHAIYQQMELRGRNRNAGSSHPAAASAAPQHHMSIPDQIAQLDNLRQQGILSEAEFAAKKADLLDRM